MRAAMFYEPGDVRMEDVPGPGQGEVEALELHGRQEGIKYEVRPPNAEPS